MRVTDDLLLSNGVSTHRSNGTGKRSWVICLRGTLAERPRHSVDRSRRCLKERGGFEKAGIVSA